MKISRNFDERRKLANELLKKHGANCQVFDSHLTEDMVKGNIENFIGAVPVPLGICGPIHINGEYAQGEFVVPMATEEGTLLASYSRGAKVMNECGGTETVVYEDYFIRAVIFRTTGLRESTKLLTWCKDHQQEIKKQINDSDPFIKLVNIDYDLCSTLVIATIHLDTGDAMGSNMSSKASGVLGNYVQKSGLVKSMIVPFPEDKKFIPNRQKGKKVIARTVLDRKIHQRITRANIDDLHEFINDYKNVLARHGGYSLNVHAANGMAALFQALGQDMAYIGECSQVLVDAKFIDKDHLEVTVTCPTLIIGTVGAGTALPAFKTALSIIDCYGAGKAKKLAEIMAAVILAGEIGCSSAQCAFEFVKAHEAMGKNDPLAEKPK